MQGRLIVEDINEALVELVQATGGWKAVGHTLRPDLAPDRAGEWLRAALDAERREVLQPSQLVLLLRRGRDQGVHTALGWLLEHLGYAPTHPVSREDEALQLRRELAVALKRQNELLADLARLESAR